MSKLKDLFMEIGDAGDSSDGESVEVYADSIKQALELAAEDLGIDISMLDYTILEKGTGGFFGIGRNPYRILVHQIASADEHDDLDELENKLSGNMPEFQAEAAKNADASFKIRVTRKGIMYIQEPQRGTGKPVSLDEVNNKLYSMRISTANTSPVEKAIASKETKPVKIGNWTPNPEHDSAMNIEVTEDEMKAFIHFSPPRYAGRHMDYDEVIEGLRGSGVVVGSDEEGIAKYLDEMDYSRPLVAAQGQKARNGKDSFIDYKVRVEKSSVSFEEDEQGKVDFRNLELLENVVVGQILAVKIPSEEGIPGRTVTNRILPAKSGKETSLQYGKGTILSEDGNELTAEINGQVVFKRGKISVEPVFVVNGDVSLETGNIVFLGSVIVSGNVLDNFVVKAAGNIEVKGAVQKAFLEAEGDIIIHQGIQGREEAKIESTGGTIFAKFVQGANIVSENDVLVPEGIVHSNVDAGERIISTGRRARIVGGVIRAGNEVNARFLGADVATKTEIRVGINPKVLQQMSELEKMKTKYQNELDEMQKNLNTLANQKKTGKLTADKGKMFEELSARNETLTARIEEINLELEELNAYIGMLEHKGKICAEKTVYPGVDIYIKDEKFAVKDEYNYIKFSLEGDEIRLSEYEQPVMTEGHSRLTTLVQRRR